MYGAVAYLETADVRICEGEGTREIEVTSTTGVGDVAKECVISSSMATGEVSKEVTVIESGSDVRRMDDSAENTTGVGGVWIGILWGHLLLGPSAGGLLRRGHCHAKWPITLQL